MAYSDFTLLKLERQFGLVQKRWKLLPAPKPVLKPSQALIDDLSFAETVPIFSEKSKSEYIITPILRDIFRRNVERATYFSGYSFDADATVGLNGICDFIVSRNTESVEIKTPVFCLVEAKTALSKKG